jgi:hypothetical protein
MKLSNGRKTWEQGHAILVIYAQMLHSLEHKAQSPPKGFTWDCYEAWALVDVALAPHLYQFTHTHTLNGTHFYEW